MLIFISADFISRVMQIDGTVEQVEQFALVLRAYMLGLAGYSLLFIVQRAFYALSDTKTPFIFTTVQVVTLALLCIPVLLVPKTFTGAAYGIAWSVATLLQGVIAVWLLRRRIGSLHGRTIAKSLLRSIVSAIPAVVVGSLIANWFLSMNPGFGVLEAILFAIIASAAAAITYVIGLWLLRTPELREVAARVRRRG